MKGWHIDDYHDKAVPYDAFIKKNVAGQKRFPDNKILVLFGICLISTHKQLASPENIFDS